MESAGTRIRSVLDLVGKVTDLVADAAIDLHPFALCQVSARNRRVGSMFHVSRLSTRSLAQDRGGLCALHVMSRAELGLRLPKTFGALDFDRALPLVDL